MAIFRSRRLNIAAVVFPVSAAMLFGLGIVPVLALPALKAEAGWLIPLVVVVSLVAGAVASWIIAPRLRSQHRRDTISG
ncbi:MAG: hypothetical protein KDJ29_09380 [Hyphomicrobiales bacterium]|nr:hypothetical protein [Hyphomicrobiales bacterium]